MLLILVNVIDIICVNIIIVAIDAVCSTSGASQRGLLASMEVTEALDDPLLTILLRLKSVTLTLQWRSTSMLGDLRSRCRIGGL